MLLGLSDFSDRNFLAILLPPTPNNSFIKMLVFGGTATRPQLNARPVDDESVQSHTSTDDFLQSPENSKQLAKLKSLNIQQQRLAKELERTRKRMNEEVARVAPMQVKSKKRGKKTSYSTDDISINDNHDDDDDSAAPQSSIGSFSSQLGIDLSSLNNGRPDKLLTKKSKHHKSASANRKNKSTTKRRKMSNDAKLTTNSLTHLPIITRTGEGAFEVGASTNEQKKTPKVGVIPVFSLPTVSFDSAFVNRIPREVRPNEILARKKEQEELLLMQQHLGLSESDLRDLEEELGLKKNVRSSENEVEKFIKQQLNSAAVEDSGSSATTQMPRRRRQQELEQDEDDYLLDRPTPRCLGLGSTSDAAELRNELGSSIYTMQALTAAVKEDVMAIQKMCKIGKSNGAASNYMKSWAVERVVAILQDLMFSYVGSSFERWRDAIRLMKKNEKMTKYLRYQGTRKMQLFFQHWLTKIISGRFITWMRNVEMIRQVERNKLENKCALILQNAWRGRLARLLVQKAKAKLKFKTEYKAAKKIQALARGCSTRTNYHRILLERARNYAALTIQCQIRVFKSIKVVKRLRLERDREMAARVLERVMRGMFGRTKAREARLNKHRNLNAIEIQRFLRGCFGRQKFNEKMVFVEQSGACVIIQKHMRRCLAIVRCRKIKEKNERERRKLEKAAIIVQKHYRGHRGRVLTRLQMKGKSAAVKKRYNMAVRLQSWARGVEARSRVKKMQDEKNTFMMNDARLWTETWSEDANTWFYHNSQTDEALWEPPPGGYTKADGRLVLKNGKVIEDPQKQMTEEEKEAKEKESKCVDCEKEEATRLCNECGDKYCTACYNLAHATGKRKDHTFIRIGPIECEECGEALATKWCTQCDDPFCDNCFDKIHRRGKRALHAYCNIDGQGQVSPRAWGPDGNPAGVFSATKQGAGNLDYESDYNQMGSYDGDSGVGSGDASAIMLGGEGSGIGGGGGDVEGIGAGAGEEGEWAVYYDDNNTPFWYSSVTGESVWEQPPGAPSAEGGNGTAAEDAVVGAADGGEWSVFQDDNGADYWYNNVTGESTYNNPAAGGGGAAIVEMESSILTMDTGIGDASGAGASAGAGAGAGAGAAGVVETPNNPWETYYDESGQAYYYHMETGESTYDKPF